MIKKVKNYDLADFLAKTTPDMIWKVNKFVAPCNTTGSPEVAGTDSPVEMNHDHLLHFFPPKPGV